MSLRTTILKHTAIARSSTTLTARGIASSAPRRAGHDDHGHSSGAGAGDEDVYTSESFFSPAWRNTLILLTASILIYPYLPSPSQAPASPSLNPEAFAQVGKDSSTPYITRLLARITPEAKVWTERNDRHLELSKESAETKLLFQEAERPRVWRMRNPGSFEAASPHGIPVGSQADLSDLKIRAA